MNRLEKRPDESIIDHHRRLVFGKMQDGSLTDVDYAELAPYVYGKELSSDSTRKMMYGSVQTLRVMEESGVYGRDIPAFYRGSEMTDTTIQQMELQKERRRMYDQRRELSKLITEQGRLEYIADRLVESANCLNESVSLRLDDDVLYVPDMDYSEAILVLCDWHYGMVTDNIWNTYNTDVCVRRVEHIVSRAMNKLKQNHCRKLHVVVLGDMIHGAIHTSARVASEELVCDQIMQVSEIMAQSICELSRYVNETYVYMTYGNHARTVQNKKDSIHRDNMERIIPWWLKQRLGENEFIHIIDESDNEFLHLNVCDVGVCAAHGDLDNVKTSPKMFATLFQKKYGKNVDCILLADKHHRDEFEELGITAMIAGSLCGTDDFANSKRLYSTPEQLMLIIRPGIGIDDTCHIKCSL